MAGYYGTALQQRLQRRADELAVWLRTAPGASNGGRLVGTDDPDAFGRETILDMLREDGIFSFRVIPVDRIPTLEEWLAAHGYRMEWWNLFRAERAAALAAVGPIIARGLPAGIDCVEVSADPHSDLVRNVQRFMAENGVVPFSGSMLVGEFGPAVTFAFMRGAAIVATAHVYRPYSTKSRNHTTAWCGLIAVAEAERGRGLGRVVNAMAVESAFTRVGAETVHEFAHATNLPSRRMIEACGLRLDPMVRSGIAGRGDARFTR